MKLCSTTDNVVLCPRRSSIGRDLFKHLLSDCQDSVTQLKLATFWQNVNVMYGDMGRVKRIWYLSPMRAAKVQASLRIRAVSPEPPLLAHTSSESRGTFRQKARSLAPLNGWACAIKICHDGMLEDTNSLDLAHIIHTILHNMELEDFITLIRGGLIPTVEDLFSEHEYYHFIILSGKLLWSLVDSKIV